MANEIKIAIIGTAGRKDDAPKMSKDIYWKMYSEALREVEQIKKDNPDCALRLVSGGAAWADQIAISLYMRKKAEALTLYLPAIFDYDNCQFQVSSNRMSPGNIANYYHKQFSKKMGGDTLQGIKIAKEKQATIITIPGFKERNAFVSKVDYLIAFTFGPGHTYCKVGDKEWYNAKEAGLKDGGTADTWTKSSAQTKIHISLDFIWNQLNKQSI